jgi:hypothetical protein
MEAEISGHAVVTAIGYVRKNNVPDSKFPGRI